MACPNLKIYYKSRVIKKHSTYIKIEKQIHQTERKCRNTHKMNDQLIVDKVIKAIKRRNYCLFNKWYQKMCIYMQKKKMNFNPCLTLYINSTPKNLQTQIEKLIFFSFSFLIWHITLIGIPSLQRSANQNHSEKAFTPLEGLQ